MLRNVAKVYFSSTTRSALRCGSFFQLLLTLMFYLSKDGRLILCFFASFVQVHQRDYHLKCPRVLCFNDFFLSGKHSYSLYYILLRALSILFSTSNPKYVRFYVIFLLCMCFVFWIFLAFNHFPRISKR